MFDIDEEKNQCDVVWTLFSWLKHVLPGLELHILLLSVSWSLSLSLSVCLSICLSLTHSLSVLNSFLIFRNCLTCILTTLSSCLFSCWFYLLAALRNLISAWQIFTYSHLLCLITKSMKSKEFILKFNFFNVSEMWIASVYFFVLEKLYVGFW